MLVGAGRLELPASWSRSSMSACEWNPRYHAGFLVFIRYHAGFRVCNETQKRDYRRDTGHENPGKNRGVGGNKG